MNTQIFHCLFFFPSDNPPAELAEDTEIFQIFRVFSVFRGQNFLRSSYTRLRFSKIKSAQREASAMTVSVGFFSE
jgi:hypothetical protein